MPTPKNKYDRKHLKNQAMYQAMIEAIFNQAAVDAAQIGASIGRFDTNKPLSFNDYPLTKRKVDELIKRLGEQIELSIVDGVRSEWTLANNKNNELCNRVFGDNLGKLTQAQYKRYYSNNETAQEAFIKRKDNGLSLSDRVWRYTDEFKDEIEMGLDIGIRAGQSAQDMAKDLKQYLKHPDMLFRRVRDEHGNLHLSKRAADFHPGRGVYRSSYMNARRLAATETNIAYRTADHLRWQQMDFVVGIEIHLSNNHNCKGVPQGMFFDICDELKGKYPKDFKFTGWHPHCRCYATTILKTEEEMDADTQKILNGEPVDGESVNKVEDVPENFKDWLEQNEERMGRAAEKGTLPYFLRENQAYVNEGAAIEGSRLNAFRSFFNHLTFKENALAEQRATPFTEAQNRNHKEVSKVIKLQQGNRKSFKEADSGRSNPKFSWIDNFLGIESEYNTNCTLTVVTHEVRMRGWDVTSLPFNLNNEIMMKMRNGAFNIAWIDPKTGVPPKINRVWAKTLQKTSSRFEEATSSVGRYHISVNWKGGNGHIFCIDRLPNGSIRMYDPQNNILNINSWLEDVDLRRGIGILKVDEMLINSRVISQIVKPY